MNKILALMFVAAFAVVAGCAQTPAEEPSMDELLEEVMVEEVVVEEVVMPTAEEVEVEEVEEEDADLEVEAAMEVELY